MRKRILAVIALALLISLLLGACSQATTKANPATSAPPSSLATTSSTTSAPTPPPAKTSSTTSVATSVAPTPQYGGILKILSPQPATVFGYTPTMRPDGETYGAPCNESLAYFDLSGDFTPKLATSWETAPDGKSIKIVLRKGVKFHDGTDFNAEAVKSNLELIRSTRGELKDVTSIEIIDPYNLQLNLSQYNNLLVTFLSSIPGKQLSPTALQKNGKDWAQTNPVGTGPFKFKEFQRDVYLKYQRFDDYWRGKPYLDGMEYYFKADVTTAKMAFLAGEAQVLMQVTPQDAKDLGAKGYTIDSTLSTRVSLAFSSNNPSSPFADQKVREAVEYAIDRKAIAAGPGYGFWQANYQIVPPTHVGYNPDLKDRSYDPAKAKQLLKDAGYPNGFKTTFISNTPVADSAVPIVTYLKEVGIDATLEVYTTAKYATALAQGWDGLLMFNSGVDPNILHRIEGDLGVHQKQYPSLLRPPVFQPTLDEAMGALNTETRKTLTQKLSKIVYDNVMIVPLYRNVNIAAKDKTVKDCNLFLDHFMHWDPYKAWLSK